MGGDGDPAPGAATEHLNLRDRLVKAISSKNPALDSPAHSNPSSTNSSRHGPRREWTLDGAGSGTLVSIHGTGSGHGSSGHGVNWHGLGGGGSGHGAGGARRAPVVHSSGSRHGVGGSRHGSDAAPLPIPENGEVLGWTPTAEGSDRDSVSEPGLLGEIGKQMSLALSGAFGSEHGSSASAKTVSGCEMMPPPALRERSGSGTSFASSLRGAVGTGGEGGKTGGGGGSGGDQDSSEEAGGIGVERVTEGFFMKTLDRAVSSLSVGGGSSAHGSGWGGSVSAGGSGHGSVGSTGVGGSGGGVGGGGGGGSRRSSGVLLPWSQQDVGDDREDGVEGEVASRVGEDKGEGDGEGDSDDLVEGLMRGVGRALTAVGVSAGAPDPPSAAADVGTPSSMIDLSAHCPSEGRRLSESRRLSTVSVADSLGGGAGYDAAMANWPAGKVEGNPAWEEWSPEKKLLGHLMTAGCLAVMILTW